MNITQLKQVLPYILKTGRTPYIVGPAGIGKTQSIRQYASENNYELICIHLGQMCDSGDLMGLQTIEKTEDGMNQSKYTLPAFFPKSKRFILFIDELNRASKDMLQAIFQLVSPDKIYNGYKLPEESVVICAANPPEDNNYDVLDFNDGAFNDRFCHIRLEPTPTEWINYATQQGLNKSIISLINENPAFLGLMENKYSLTKIVPTPRGIEQVAKFIDTALDKCANKLDLFLVKEICSGIVGIDFTQKLFKFRETYFKLISLKDILNNYEVVQDRIKNITNNKENDLLIPVVNELIAHLQSNKVTSNDLKIAAKFTLDIPKDLAISLWVKIYKSESIINLIKTNYDDFNDIDLFHNPQKYFNL